MRRKSSRNTRTSSPDKAKVETQKKTRRQSSRRRKRSSSRSSEESDDIQPDCKDSVKVEAQNSAQSTDVKSESDPTKSEKIIDSIVSDKVEDTNKMETSLEVGPEVNAIVNKEDNKDSEEWKEGNEDMEEKKNKGKSKGKNNSNFEQSSNNIEPETENENVQGTHQSPSNDYADNENVVQNVNDTEKIDSKVQEDKCEDIKVIENQAQQENVEAGFESEYAQVGDSSQGNKNVEPDEITEKVQFSNDRSDTLHENCEEEKSTTPEPRTNNENDVKNMLERNPSNEEYIKPDSPENSGSKKKITLRRSPPTNKDAEKVVTSEGSALKIEQSSDEKNINEELKTTKKITLKRHTTDDSNTSRIENKTENFTRSFSVEIVERNRRLSSGTDDKEQNRQDKPKKIHKPVKLIRDLSRDNVDDEEKSRRIALRRQRWGKSDWLNKLTSSFYKVDVESIKIVCPSLEFLSEDEVNLESTPRERKKSESDHKRKVSIDNKSEDSDRPSYEKQTSEDSSGEPKAELNPNIIAMNRKISIVDDTASKLRPPPSPAKNPTSDVLFITNLVRPFTVKQLKELLERTGKIKEEGFWTDRIKSKCYVQYESVEEAEATRNALHGVHWPIGNGKKLDIDYASVEDLEKAKNPTPAPAVLPEKIPEKENREPERGDSKFKEREERRKRDAPVREWDLGKEESRKRFSRSRSRSRERARKHSRRSYTPEEFTNNKKRKTDDAVPQKLMDDLFLKTKATPSVYWQPLSPEEIIMKQQQRLVRMEEHKRRIEETRGRTRDVRRAPFRRR